MFDVAVGFLLLGLALMGLLQLLAGLGKLRYKNLADALGRLVDSCGVPKGFLSHVLVERALADPRLDPESPGVEDPKKGVAPAGRVTRVNVADFAAAAKAALAVTPITALVDGLSVRPPAVQEEVKAEVSGLGERLVAQAGARFDGAMAAAADGYKRSMRLLSVLIGAPIAVLFLAASGLDVFELQGLHFILLGIFVVPMFAGMWYGLLRDVLKLAPAAERAMSAAAGSPRPRRTDGRSGRSGGSRPQGGPSGGGSSQGSSEKPASSSSGTGTSRRRGRRPGRRRPGGGGSGGSSGGGGSGGGGGNG